jgi:septum formation protein
MTALLVLASTSPQRQAILEQLRIPFEVVAPDYVEDDPPDAEPAELVRRHAEGKARSVHGEGRITLGVDTTVVLDGKVYGKRETRRRACSTSSRAARTRSSPGSAFSARASRSSGTR